MDNVERNLKDDSIEIIKSILTSHTYSFHMFRRIFESRIDDDEEMLIYWYNDGDFRNMRLYKFLTEIGYRKKGTVLEKIKG